MSPRSLKQFETIREEKKTLIMDVALHNFANRGFKATTIDIIARQAGISRGLIYNYFENKEDLLAEIIDKSASEIYKSFDINRDGYLSDYEFEYFIRKTAYILNEKQNFWKLFFQVLLQSEVRIHFLNSFLGTETLIRTYKNYSQSPFLSSILKMITEYFVRKKEKRGPDYDPYLDLNMFLLTIKGFAVTYVFMDEDVDEYFQKTVENIITTFK